MCVAAAVVGGAAVLGAGANMYAANKAAGSQKDAANQANATQRDMYNQTRQDLSPYNQTGQNAAAQLGNFYGLGGGQNVDYQKLLSSQPGYQFQLQTGSQAVNQNLAARGLLQSGAAGKALMQYGQGLGASYVDKYTSGLMGLANLGENAGAGQGAAGANAASNISQGQIYAGNAQAGGYINSANAIGGGLQGLAGAYGQYGQGNGAWMGGGGYNTGGVSADQFPADNNSWPIASYGLT